MEYLISKVEDWATVAADLSTKIVHPVLLLKGNLGAGKTTFVQFLMKELGSKDSATSPSYSIVNEYDTPAGKVFHFDFYRLHSPAEVEDIGIYDYLEHGKLCIIEWPDVFREALEEYPYHEMVIENLQNQRRIFFK